MRAGPRRATDETGGYKVAISGRETPGHPCYLSKLTAEASWMMCVGSTWQCGRQRSVSRSSQDKLGAGEVGSRRAHCKASGSGGSQGRSGARGAAPSNGTQFSFFGLSFRKEDEESTKPGWAAPGWVAAAMIHALRQSSAPAAVAMVTLCSGGRWAAGQAAVSGQAGRRGGGGAEEEAAVSGASQCVQCSGAGSPHQSRHKNESAAAGWPGLGIAYILSLSLGTMQPRAAAQTTPAAAAVHNTPAHKSSSSSHPLGLPTEGSSSSRAEQAAARRQRQGDPPPRGLTTCLPAVGAAGCRTAARRWEGGASRGQPAGSQAAG